MSHYTWVATDEQLRDYCESIQSCPYLFIDTEFIRIRTFYPIAGLIQVNDGSRLILIDPLTINDWQPLKSVLESTTITKVLHACEEDVELFWHLCGAKTTPVFDTQVAAAFCGYDFSMGYQRLVNAVLDVELEKAHSRSDWTQRPLSEEQLRYALDDVIYLARIFELIYDKVKAANSLEFVFQEYEETIAHIISDDFSQAFFRLKSAWKLKGSDFEVCKALAEWRERMMREKDIPRNKVFTNEALVELSTKKPATIKPLFTIAGLPASTVKHNGSDIIALVQQSMARENPRMLPRPPKSDPLLQNIRQALTEQAEANGFSEKMLNKKLFVEALYHEMNNNKRYFPVEIKGWRKPFYEKARAVVLDNEGATL